MRAATLPTAIEDTFYEQIALAQLQESALNPRQRFDEAKLAELVESFRAKGVLQPLLVRPMAGGRYEIAAGHRRFRAAQKAGLATVPVVVRRMSDADFLEVLTIENLGHEDLHPLEQARGYESLLAQAGANLASVAAKVGKRPAEISRTLGYLRLIAPGQEAFLAGQLGAGQAWEICRLEPKDQPRVLKIALNDDRWRGRISASELAEWIRREILRELHAAPFSKKDATLVPEAGACLSCPKRSGFDPEVHRDLGKKDVCFDPACFEHKMQAHIQIRKQELADRDGKPPALVSSEYRSAATTSDGAVIPRGRWEEVTGKKKCGSAQAGLILAGDERGKVLTICADPKCKVHHPYGAARDRDQARWKRQQKTRAEKQRREEAVRPRILAAILAKAPAKLGRPELAQIATDFFQHALPWSQAPEFIRTMDSTAGKKLNYANARATFQKLITAKSAEELARLLLSMSLTRHLHRHPYEGPDLLLEAAKRYRVDAKKIERQVAAELRAKRKPARAARKK